MRLTRKIVLASENSDKLKEFRELFTSYPEIELMSAGDLLTNPEKIGKVENFETYLENAAAKARVVNRGLHYPTLADDTGLEVLALEGKPGVRSHRYAQPPAERKTPWTSNDQARANIELLLTELKLRPRTPRTAQFVCVLTLLIEGLLVHTRGVLEGTIAEAPQGKNGFGYDSVFIPNGSRKTLAEMTDAEKNAISHRARAVHELMAQLQGLGITLVKP